MNAACDLDCLNPVGVERSPLTLGCFTDAEYVGVGCWRACALDVLVISRVESDLAWGAVLLGELDADELRASGVDDVVDPD